MTQEELAERMGVNRSTYAQMERSQKPHLATLEKAAAALQINLVHLVELYDD